MCIRDSLEGEEVHVLREAIALIPHDVRERHGLVVGLRAVTSVDGMTADFYPFDMRFLGMVATRIINEVKGVNRVVYDVTLSLIHI